MVAEKGNGLTAGSFERSPAVRFKQLFKFSKPEIDAAFQNAKRIAKTKEITVLRAPSDLGHGKLLIIVPRKVGKAYKRNLLKRQLKAIFYESKAHEIKSVFIILAHKGAVEMEFEALRKFVSRLLHDQHRPANHL